MTNGHKTASGENFIYDSCEYCGAKLDNIERAYFMGLCRAHANNMEGIMIPHELPTYDRVVKHLKVHRS